MFKTARKLAVESLRKGSGTNQNTGIYNLVYSKDAEDCLTRKTKTVYIDDTTKQALRLIYFKTYTVEGAAYALNITVNDLRANLERAIEQLNSVAI